MSDKDFKNIEEEIRFGSQIINPSDKIITTFGSARTKPTDPRYGYAYDLSYKLGKAGFSIMTGGGPGIMEASSKGGYDAGVVTYGINIELPHEQSTNKYITKSFVCNSMLSRKHLLMSYSIGFVVFEGGFGTLDELFGLLTLISTSKMNHVPVVLTGSLFWNGLRQWLEDALMDCGYISSKEAGLMTIMDDHDEIAELFVKKSFDK